MQYLSKQRRHAVAITTLALSQALAVVGATAAEGAGAAPVPGGDAIATATSSAPAADRELAGAELLAALRRGGWVIYFRHAATDYAKNDAAMQNYGDCANQRLLSAQGRSQAKAIGERILALKIPLGEVYASPMCRTMAHATLTFGRATPAPEMRETDGGDYPGLKALLSRPVAQGRNRWLVGHGTPFRAVAGAPQLAEGESAVLAPGGDHWTVVARIGVDAWRNLGVGASGVAAAPS